MCTHPVCTPSINPPLFWCLGTKKMQQTREGRRTKMHVCDSIIPLLDRSDYDIILNRVGHAIEAYRQSGDELLFFIILPHRTYLISAEVWVVFWVGAGGGAQEFSSKMQTFHPISSTKNMEIGFVQILVVAPMRAVSS